MRTKLGSVLTDCEILTLKVVWPFAHNSMFDHLVMLQILKTYDLKTYDH